MGSSELKKVVLISTHCFIPPFPSQKHVFIGVVTTAAGRQPISCDGKTPWVFILLGLPVPMHAWTSRTPDSSVREDVYFPGRDGLVTLVSSVSSVSRQSVPFGPNRMGR